MTKKEREQMLHQLLMQLHSEDKITTRTLVEGVGLNYNRERKLLKKIQGERK